jgi:hypothetical protein
MNRFPEDMASQAAEKVQCSGVGLPGTPISRLASSDKPRAFDRIQNLCGQRQGTASQLAEKSKAVILRASDKNARSKIPVPAGKNLSFKLSQPLSAVP